MFAMQTSVCLVEPILHVTCYLVILCQMNKVYGENIHDHLSF